MASALARLLLSLPHFVLLALLGVVGGVLALVAGFLILTGGRVPASVRSFQQELVGWIARVLVYHASLVQAFPPMMFARKVTEPDEPTMPRAVLPDE